MKILVRNSEHVSECVLIGGYLPREEILKHPQVQNMVGSRRVQHVSMHQPDGEIITVDLDITNPR